MTAPRTRLAAFARSMLVAWLCLPVLLSAQFTQTASPGSFSPVTPGNEPWSFPNNLSASDNQYASTSGNTCGFGCTGTSQTLRTGNYGFTLPANAQVLGITVTIEAGNFLGNNFVQDTTVRILQNGSITGIDHATGANVPLGENVFTYGGCADTWLSAGNWTPSEINDNTFGVAFGYQLFATISQPMVMVDHVEITVCYDIPLADTWFNLSANREGKGVVLNWETNAAIACTDFTVSRSDDGKTFVEVGEVPAGPRGQIHEFADPAASDGNNWYQVAAVDADGRTLEAQIAFVAGGDAEDQWSVFPNPVAAGEILTVRNDAPEAAPLRISLYDFRGKFLGEFSSPDPTARIATTGLKPGMYLLSVRGGKGLSWRKVMLR